MGGRGSFVDVKTGNFAFKDGGQTYYVVGQVGDIEILERPNQNVKAPEFSHTANRIYAVIQNGNLKHLAFYDENHGQIRCVDFEHVHGWNDVKPHVHINLEHNDDEPGTPPNNYEIGLANQVKEWLKGQKGK